MIKQGNGGKIIGASSTAGKQGNFSDKYSAGFSDEKIFFEGFGMGLGSYSSTKFAVRGLTQSAGEPFKSLLVFLGIILTTQ